MGGSVGRFFILYGGRFRATEISAGTYTEHHQDATYSMHGHHRYSQAMWGPRGSRPAWVHMLPWPCMCALAWWVSPYCTYLLYCRGYQVGAHHGIYSTSWTLRPLVLCTCTYTVRDDHTIYRLLQFNLNSLIHLWTRGLTQGYEIK